MDSLRHSVFRSLARSHNDFGDHAKSGASVNLCCPLLIAARDLSCPKHIMDKLRAKVEDRPLPLVFGYSSRRHPYLAGCRRSQLNIMLKSVRSEGQPTRAIQSGGWPEHHLNTVGEVRPVFGTGPITRHSPATGRFRRAFLEPARSAGTREVFVKAAAP